MYRNQRDGTFADVSARAGIAREFGPALGIATADFNGDGWIDIYVANDGHDNQLWINQRNGTFVNTALLSGAALTAEGKAEASMGVDAGDFDNDGDEDLFMTELTGEGANLYVNDGTGTFEDRSTSSGLGAATLSHTGFGTAWVDVDNDGRLDILTVNGAVQTIQALVQAHDPFPLHQRKQLLRNLGDRKFEDVTARAGAVFQVSEVSRGAAFGDIDNDGDVDVVVGNNNGPTRLLINNIGSRAHWVGLRLTREATRRDVRDMLGARVEILRKNAASLMRRAPCRRELRVGERSPGARRPRRFDGAAGGSGAMAERPRGGVDRCPHRSVHHVDGRHREMSDACDGPAQAGPHVRHVRSHCEIRGVRL